MSRSYGIRRDFGLHNEGGGVFLPELQEDSSVATPSESSPNYHSTMPAYDQHKRGRGQHGKLNISSVDKGASYPQSSSGKGASYPPSSSVKGARHPPSSSGKGASYPPSSSGKGASYPQSSSSKGASYPQSSPGKGARFTPSSSTASPTSPPPQELEKKESSEAKEKKSRGWFGSNKKKKSDKGGIPLSPGIIVEGVAKEESMIRSSPMLHIRSAMQKGAKDQFGRPQVDPSEPEEDDEARMQFSYDMPVESTRAATELVRLTLRPDKAVRSTDTLQVTLRKRGQGFGLHLTSGLPPITVTYVEPGGDAEAAGVSVGDEVVEVNGEECETLRDTTKIVALKMMIQQTEIREKVAESSDSEGEGEKGLNDSAWSKIQARQRQDEVDSHTSSNVELTQIDDASDTEITALEKFREKAGKHSQQKKEVEISATEWKRMREQRELLFDRNAPSAVIHQKGREKEERKVSRLLQDHSSSQKTQDVSGQKQKSDGVTNIDEIPEKKKKTKSSGGWFRRKKKSSVTSCDSNDAPATVTATGTGTRLAEAVTVKREEEGGRKKSFGRKKERKVQEKKEAGKKQATVLQTSPGSSVGGRKGEQQRRVEAGEEEDGRVTSIDDEDEEGRGEEGNRGQVKVKVETERVRKAFSYEGPPATRDARAQRSYVSTSLPRSKSHQTSITVQPQSPVSVEAPVIAHHRSKSYQEEEDGGGREGGWGGTELSIADTSETRPVSKVEIESNLRMKKSGLVKGVSSRGVGQRPTLEVFGAGETEGKGKADLYDVVPFSSTGKAPDLDLAAIPRTIPSLGRCPGHTRRDLVARSSVKRRPASHRAALLLQVDESQKMGTKRVELSDSNPRARSHTLPEKVSRKVIEATLLSSVSQSAKTHEGQTQPKSSEARSIIRERLHKENSNGLQLPDDAGERQRSNSVNIQRQSSANSTAEMVARAVAVKRQLSSSTPEQERKIGAVVLGATGATGEAAGGEEGEQDLSSLQGGTTGSAILARLRQKKQVESNGKERGPDVGEDGGRTGGEGERSRPSSASRSRRKKTVERPVKSLGIASELPLQIPKVTLRKTTSETRPRSFSASSSSTTPSWVAMAEMKKKRVSAIFERDTSERQLAPEPEAPKTAPSPTPKQPPSPTPKQPPSPTPKQPPSPTPKQPPSPTPKQPPSPTPKPPPSPAAPTTSTPHTVTSPTPHTITSSTPETKEGRVTNQSSIPRMGHVKDRLAMFQ